MYDTKFVNLRWFQPKQEAGALHSQTSIHVLNWSKMVVLVAKST